jgi:hypothetical protein
MKDRFQYPSLCPHLAGGSVTRSGKEQQLTIPILMQTRGMNKVTQFLKTQSSEQMKGTLSALSRKGHSSCGVR